MASYLPNLSTDNVSFYAIPAMWLISVMPRVWAGQLYQSKANKWMDIRAPRELAKTIADDKKFDTATRERIMRAEAAQANGFENIALFAAAIVAGNAAKLDPKLMNGLSITYLVSRLLYNYVYINNTTRRMALMRSAAFTSGLAIIFTIFIKAGAKMQASLI